MSVPMESARKHFKAQGIDDEEMDEDEDDEEIEPKGDKVQCVLLSCFCVQVETYPTNIEREKLALVYR